MTEPPQLPITAGVSRRSTLSMLAGAAIGGSTVADEAGARAARSSEARAFRIRTLTAGTPVKSLADLSAIEATLDFLAAAKRTFEAESYEVQTTRVAVNPLLLDVSPSVRAEALPQLVALDKLLIERGAIISIGPVLSRGDEAATLGTWVRQLIGRTRAINFSAMVASSTHGVHREAVSAAARIMAALSDVAADGVANFRFAAAACVPPGTPFFPAGYHEGSAALAIGVESANLVTQAFSGAADPVQASERLRAVLDSEFKPIEALGRKVARQAQRRYLGIDSSPAPGINSSIGRALEALTGQPFGEPSSLQACAAVTKALKSLAVTTCGYSGLMLPILEDPTLATRAAGGGLGIAKLLLYSSVCGTGLDLVPLPGDVEEAQMARIIGDVATLAVRLSKPLSARLFPVPGKQVGDALKFVDPLLTASRVLSVDS